MAAYLRLGIWFAGAVLLFFFVAKYLARLKKKKPAAIRIEKALNISPDWNHDEWQDNEEKHSISMPLDTISEDITPVKSAPIKIMSLHVVAKSGCYFASYDLLQAISATGMQFGAMNIFHYYLTTEMGQRVLLFSLASATEPGEFDLDNMGDFTCSGLTLFMNLNQVPDAEQAFSLMLEVAEQLADDLCGDIMAANHQPFSEDLLIDYQEQLTHYQTRRYECTAPDCTTS